MNPPWERIHWLIWCTIIWVILVHCSWSWSLRTLGMHSDVITNIILFNNGNLLRIIVWCLSLYYIYHVQLTIACVFIGRNRSCSEVWQCQCCWQDDSLRVWCQGWSEINLLISHFYLLYSLFAICPPIWFHLIDHTIKIILCAMSFNVFMKIILCLLNKTYYYYYYCFLCILNFVLSAKVQRFSRQRNVPTVQFIFWASSNFIFTFNSGFYFYF